MATTPLRTLFVLTRIPAVALITASAAAAQHAPATPRPDEACRVSGPATTVADVVRARLACADARASFAELFGDDAPRAMVVLHDERGYEVGLAGDVGVVFWPNGAALGESAGDSARAAAYWSEVLPHEIMHALTMARFFAGTRVDGHGGYGTPLPDWFEEAIGIWGEPAASRKARVAHARELPPDLLDLEAILRGTHPAAGNAGLMAPVPGAPAPADPAVRAFYPQAIAVLSFVFEAGGSEAVRQLAGRFLRNPADPQPLVGLPGMPSDPAAVAAAWHRWIRRH